MLKLENISHNFSGSLLLDDISLAINPGEKLGLVGRNGSGKTTLLNIIYGNLKPETGKVIMPNSYKTGYVLQTLKFTKPTVSEEVCSVLSDEMQFQTWRAEKILSGLGFDADDMQKAPDLFSGGFQVRINLAKALVIEPDLLLLDEPTNYLDVVSIRWLVRFIRSFPREVIIITHDRSVLDSVCTHIAGLYRKKIKKIKGDTSNYYDQIAKEEEVYEKTRLNDEKKHKQTEEFINKFRAKARLAGLVQSRIKALNKNEKKHKIEKLDSLDFSFSYTPYASKNVLKASNINFKYPEMNKMLISDLSINIEKNDRIGIIGQNGKGKSTLLQILNGDLKPVNGQVESYTNTEIGYYGQAQVKELNNNSTIETELMNASSIHDRKKIRDICGTMLFKGNDALKKIQVLSGGEKNRVLLGKILLHPANLLLLDEPTNHLDMEACDSLLSAIDCFPGAVLLVTHNELYLNALVNKLIIFDQGKVHLFKGSYQDFLQKEGWSTEQIGQSNNAKSRDQSNKKEIRKKRSELIQNRSQELKPVTENLSRLEEEIIKIEEKIEQNNHAMIEASKTNDSIRIQSLAQENHILQEKNISLYEKMEDILQLKEKIQNKYESRMTEINQ